MSFPFVPFGSLYAVPVRNGLTRPTAVRGDGYRMVNMGELFAYDRIADQHMERVQLNERELQVATLEVGDLLFARSSLKAEGTGKCSLIQAVPEVTTFESHIIRARLDRSKADSRFYFYFFQSYLGRATVLSIAKQVGAAGLPGSKLASLSVPQPSTITQSRIADALSAYDDMIENNCRRMDLLEGAARQLYCEWFIRLRFPGHEHTPIVGGLPSGWEARVLGDLCSEVRETVQPESLEPGTPYIGLEHMPRRSISLSEWGAADQVTSSKHRFREGEVLFGKIRPYFHKVGIAFVDGVASSDAIVIRPTAPRLRGLVLMTVSSDPFVAMAAQTMKEGAKMPRADWKHMQKYATPEPPASLLSTFENTVQGIIEQLKTLAVSNQKLRVARDLLLPRLIAGEIAA